METMASHPPPSLPDGSFPVDFEELVGEEWAEWYSLTPQQRWERSLALWDTFILLGGSLDPEPDSQSPFYDPEAPGPGSTDGRAGLRVLRRSRI
jgi:hypothetical protein